MKADRAALEEAGTARAAGIYRKIDDVRAELSANLDATRRELAETSGCLPKMKIRGAAEEPECHLDNFFNHGFMRIYTDYLTAESASWALNSGWESKLDDALTTDHGLTTDNSQT